MGGGGGRKQGKQGQNLSDHETTKVSDKIVEDIEPEPAKCEVGMEGGKGEEVRGWVVRHGGKERGEGGGDGKRNLGMKNEETSDHETNKGTNNVVNVIEAEPAKCEVGKEGGEGEEVQGQDVRHGGSWGGEGGEDKDRKIERKNEEMKHHGASNVTDGSENGPDTEPVKHGRSKRHCTRQKLFSIFGPRTNKSSRLGKETSGDGGNEVGARGEVVMDAREDPILGDSGKPRDEKGYGEELRVWDPGSGAAGTD